MSEPLTQYKSTFKDLPKVEGKPKPEENMVWTVYLRDGRMRACLHPKNDNSSIYFDAEISYPIAFCSVVDAFRGKA